jgi:hypothetical protein
MVGKLGHEIGQKNVVQIGTYIYTLSTVCQNVLSKVVELGSVADRNDLQREADTSPSPAPKEFAFDGVFGESSAMGLAWPSRLAREAKSHLNH